MHQKQHQNRITTMSRTELFSDASTASIFSKLETPVFIRLSEERSFYAKKKLYFYGVLSATSFIVNILTIEALHKSFSSSGTYEFMTLFLTDTNVAFEYSRDIALAFVESLPFLAILVGVIAFSTLIYSSLKVIKLALTNGIVRSRYTYHHYEK